MSDKLERTLKEPGVNNFKAVFYTWKDINNENPQHGYYLCQGLNRVTPKT
jgi:hypothetical protein